MKPVALYCSMKAFVVLIIIRTVGGYLWCITGDGWGDNTEQNLLSDLPQLCVNHCFKTHHTTIQNTLFSVRCTFVDK
jgi:hypothetical protein